jgi:hypothetical protein
VGYELPFHSRDVATILLKCGIGTRKGDGKITIERGGKQKKGYTSIIHIPPDEPIDDDSEED